MEKLKVAPFSIATEKYVAVHRINILHILHKIKSISFLFITKSLKNLVELVDVSP